MDKWSSRDQVILNYISRESVGTRSFSMNSSPRFPFRNSDAGRQACDSLDSTLDFRDVFGGPPRSSLIKETRSSLSQAYSADSKFTREEALQSRNPREEALQSRNPWLAQREKPVFCEDSPNHRRHISQDFFSDIYGGEDPSSTPKMLSRNPFSSTPASRMLSPRFASLAKCEPFSGGSSLPPPLSLPTRPGKGIDYSALSSPTCRSPNNHKHNASNAFGFPYSSSAPSSRIMALDENINSRLQTQSVQGQDDLRNDTRPFYRQSPLSHEFYLNCDGSSKATKSASQNKEGNLKKEPTCSEGSYNNLESNDQFHFSIHKWASKGMALLMPAKGGDRSKYRDKKETRVSLLRKTIFPEVDIPYGDENSSTAGTIQDHCKSQDSSFSCDLDSKKKEQCLQQERKLPSGMSSSTLGLDLHGSVEEVVPASTQASCRPEFISLHIKETNEEPGRESRFYSDMSCATPDVNSSKGIENQVSISLQKACKPELKNHVNLLNDRSIELGKEKMAREAGEKEAALKSFISAENIDGGKKVKMRARNMKPKHGEATGPTLEELSENSEAKMIGNRVKGKVKEFIKLFNQEASQKATRKAGTKNQSSVGQNPGTSKVEDQISVSAAKVSGEAKMADGSPDAALKDVLAVADQIWRETEKADLDIDFSVQNTDVFLSERTVISVPCFESTLESCDIKLDNVEEPRDENCQHNCLPEQLPVEQEQQAPTGQHKEELENYDAKIRQWSSGKEGNIRSLLSTLQYVLWPGSGWKPIPLVDIIDGTSVKRSYQKALLCLHPDKLQQKGVTFLQKHIADKVFDILQEAWAQFNSAGSF